MVVLAMIDEDPVLLSWQVETLTEWGWDIDREKARRHPFGRYDRKDVLTGGAVIMSHDTDEVDLEEWR